MKTQATRCTQEQLAYLAYWQARGAKFGRDDVIPESTDAPPCNRADLRDLVWSAAGLIILAALAYFKI